MAVLTMEYKSQALLRGVTVKVILPNDGMASPVKPPFKTLYFLPGYSATGMELLTYLPFRKQAELKGIAIVFPESENLFYQDYPDKNTLYSTYVGKELVEVTRNLLPLSCRREDTYIGGISMGGYGALYNGLRYRDTFSKIAAFSPVTNCCELMVDSGIPGFSNTQFESLFTSKEAYFAGDCNVFRFYKETKDIPDLFLCCGTDDRMVYKQVAEFHHMLEEEKITHKYRELPGDHEFHFWEKMMDPAFSFLADIPENTRNALVIPG